MAQWLTGTVTKVTHWTSSLFSLTVAADIDPFTAGQFAKLALDIDGQRIQRAYSFVNAPASQQLEFYIINVPEGKLSPHLHRLQVGEQLWITKESAGFFVLDEVPDCQVLWMLATGTAVGPYLSMLQQAEQLNRFAKINLVHAVRRVEDLSYAPLMQQLQTRHADRLAIQMITSRQTDPQTLTGRIPALIANGQLETALQTPLQAENSHVMLCGNPQMVRDTQQLLKEQRQMQRHLRRKPGQITSENYW